MKSSSPSSAESNRSRRPIRERLRRLLLPTLAFHEPVETKFRAWYTRQARSRMLYIVLPSMLLLLTCTLAGGPFRTLRETLFGAEPQPIVDVLRFGIMTPTCIAMLLVTYTRLYTRWLSLTSQAVALMQGLCFVAVDALMQRRGYSLSSWMPLVAISPFMVFGLLQYQAAWISAAIVAAYLIAGWLDGLSTGQRYFDALVVAFASLMGFTIHYGFAQAVRYNWFNHQLLSDSANRDSLTGIANRRLFDVQIDRLWQQAVRSKVPLALLLIDLDQFKRFNDRCGHQAGDACLEKIARAIARAARRPLDLAARYGGEEFVVLLYDVRRDRVEELCRELHANIDALAIPHPDSSVSRHVTASIGAACVEPRAGRRPEGFIQLADEALYTAKERGRHRTIIMDREYETLETGAFRVPRSRKGMAA